MSTTNSRVDDLDDAINRKWEERAKHLSEVKSKLRSGWRNDPQVLHQYFQSCVENWKVYKGSRTPQQVLKVQSIYRQAVYGDNNQVPPENLTSLAGQKWSAWYKLKGMPQDMARRRFITYLSEIDPMLIDVMPDEKPPEGFPLDRFGRPICAKCNTVVGCERDLLNEHKVSLRKQLFECPDLHEPKKLRQWVRTALANQRCVWGMHTAISKAEAKPFMHWFDRDENRGFMAYDSSGVMFILRELLTNYYEISYDMQMHKDEYDPQQFNDQVIKTMKVKEVYQELSGENFVFEVLCDRNIDLCNQRRLADGGLNHTHPVELDPPTLPDPDTYEDAIELRMQCIKLGLNPATGAVRDISERCEIYRKRIMDHFEAVKKAEEAKKRLDVRAEVHKREKKKIQELSSDMINRQCWEACHENLPERVMTLIKRGCDPNEESPRGLTPLLCFVLNNPPIELVEELLKLKANINSVNAHGITPLMLAVRLRMTKMIHVFMKNGASALQSGLRRGKGMTALHHCAIHGCEEEAKILMEYVKDGGGDAHRMIKFLDAANEDGETSLMMAAKRRNGLMCKVLSGMGANPNMRNAQGRTAAYLARHNGWAEIADWLEKKSGSGVSKVETYGDLQFDKSLRYGAIRCREQIFEFTKLYLGLIQDRPTLCILGPPSKSSHEIDVRGQRALDEQKSFVDNHQLYIFNRTPDDGIAEPSNEVSEILKKMKACVELMTEDMRQGILNPNTESDPKPMPWTPLMCAAIINDVRSLKLMLREGADPNYPNRNGTTALMLAAQLNNIPVFVEMLLNGGNIDCFDNEGYNVTAYANSLPLPSCLECSRVSVLLDQDNIGPKRLSAKDVLDMAKSLKITGSPSKGSPKRNGKSNSALNKSTLNEAGVELRRKIEDAEIAANPENVENEFQFLRLLEKYGLTRVETIRHLHDQTRSSEWRLDGDYYDQMSQNQDDLTSEASSELVSVDGLPIDDKDDGSVGSSSGKSSQGTLRCPVCTLWVPCVHFFKVSTLKKLLDKQNSSHSTDAKTSYFAKPKSLQLKDKRKLILEEAHLADRNTDRSATVAKTYRPREIAIEKEDQRRYLEYVESQKITNGNEESPENENWEIEDSKESNEGNLLMIEDSERNDKQNIENKEQIIVHESREKLSDVQCDKIIENGNSVVEIRSNNDHSSGDENKDSNIMSQVLKSSLKSVLSTNESEKVPKKVVRFNLDVQYEPDEVVTDQQIANPSIDTVSSITAEKPLDSPSNVVEPKTMIISSNITSAAPAIASTATSTLTSTLAPSSTVLSNAVVAEESSRKKLAEQPVSSTEITTSDQDSSKASSSPQKTKKLDKSSILEALLEGHKNSKENLGENPVPIDHRKLYPYTKDPLSRSAPFMKSFSSSLSALEEQRVLTPKQKRRQGQTSLPGKEWKEYPPLPKMVLSGWTFVSLGLIDKGEPPISSISLPLSVFGGILEHLRLKFSREWMKEYQLSCVFDIRMGKFAAPRCTVCNIGFIRSFQTLKVWNPESPTSLLSLPINERVCLSCMIRFELFEKSKLIIPRSERRQLKEWPFFRRFPLKEMDSNTEKYHLRTELEICREDITETKKELLLRHLNLIEKSPIASAQLFEMEEKELDWKEMTTKGMLIDNDSLASSTTMSLSVDTLPIQSVKSPLQSPQASWKKNQSLGSPLKNRKSQASKDEQDSQEELHQHQEEDQLLEEAVPVDESPEIQSFGSETTVSTNPVTDFKNYGPRELSLIPYFLAQGHLEEVERLIRVVLGRSYVNEGEGLAFLLKILLFQGEMYQLIGLWPLAWAVLLDSSEMAAALLGYQHNLTLQLIAAMLACMRRMQMEHEAKNLMIEIYRRVEGSAASDLRIAMAKRIIEFDKQNRKKQKEMDSILQVKKEDIPSRWHDKVIFSTYGFGGFLQMLTSSEGYYQASKLAFEYYCQYTSQDRHLPNLKICMDVVNAYLRLRICCDEESRRHIVQQMMQWYFPNAFYQKKKATAVHRWDRRKALSADSSLQQASVALLALSEKSMTDVFLSVTSAEDLHRLKTFVQFGIPVEDSVFHSILAYCLDYLVPYFKRFFFGYYGSFLRDNYSDMTAQAFYATAMKIQCLWRGYSCRQRLATKMRMYYSK